MEEEKQGKEVTGRREEERMREIKIWNRHLEDKGFSKGQQKFLEATTGNRILSEHCVLTVFLYVSS